MTLMKAWICALWAVQGSLTVLKMDSVPGFKRRWAGRGMPD